MHMAGPMLSSRKEAQRLGGVMEQTRDDQTIKDRALAAKLRVDVTCGFTGRPSVRLNQQPGGVMEAPVRTYAWQLWPGRNWPATAAEEAVFEAELVERAGGRKKRKIAVSRGEITAVCNALRCGLTAEELFKKAPGMKPASLLAAYDALEKMRAHSVGAWERIVEERTLEAIVDHGYAARVLVPWGVMSVSYEAAEVSDAEISQRIDQVVTEMQKAAEKALELEAMLEQCEAPSAVGVELGRVLYDPYYPGVWDKSEFVPNRVGVLTPRRLARMLDEVR
jgi:hypothetical protein